MKKALMILAAVTAMAGAALAGPTATVLFKPATGLNLFYQNVGLTTLTPAGWYVEIILSQNNSLYDGSTRTAFDSYLTIPGVYNGIASIHQTGKTYDGGTLGNGAATIKWEFTDSAYVGWYATFRVYDNAAGAVNGAKYGVSPGWQKITAIPSDNELVPIRPTTADQQITFGPTAKAWVGKYDVPAVPEPTTMALFGLGGLALVLRRKLRKDA